MFSNPSLTTFMFSVAYKLLFANAFTLERAKIIFLSDKELTLYQTTIFWTRLNSKHLQMTNVAKIMISVFDRIKTVGKGENTGYLHFLLFPQCFQKPSHPGS